MWYYARALARGSEVTNWEGIARCLNTPEGYTTWVYSLDELDPITKIQEETFYQFVKKSIQQYSVLYNPLIIHPVSLEDWQKEMELDHDQTPPRKRDQDLHLRIQAGCNRFFAVKALGYTAVECVVEPDLDKARDLAHLMRIDKKWQRGSNMQAIIEAKGV